MQLGTHMVSFIYSEEKPPLYWVDDRCVLTVATEKCV